MKSMLKLFAAALIAAAPFAAANASDSATDYRPRAAGSQFTNKGFVLLMPDTDGVHSVENGPDHPIYISGSVDAGPGASNYALETGGNLAGIKTDLDSILTGQGAQATAANQSTANSSLSTVASNTGTTATAAGAPADAAYTSGSGSIVSILKGIFGNTSGVSTAANQSTANSSLSTIASNTSGLATAAAQTTGNSSLSTIGTNTGTTATGVGAPADSAWVSGSGSIIAVLKGIFGNTTGLATAANQSTGITNTGTTNTDLGPPGATACATDTGSCSLNALIQRIAQRLSTVNTTLNSPFQAGGSIGNTTFGSTPDNVTDGANTSASAAAAGDLTGTPISTVGYAAVQVNVSAFSATAVTFNASFDGGSTYSLVLCHSLTGPATADNSQGSAVGVWECPAGDHFKLTQSGTGATTAKIALKRVPFTVRPLQYTSGSTNSTTMTLVGGYDGSVVRRFTTDTSGNSINVGPAAVGAAVSGAPVMAGFSDGTNAQYGKVSADKGLMVTPVSPAAANILYGRQTFTSTTGATTLITVTAGKTWIGALNASVNCNAAAASATACKANATFTTTGANMTPAAGTYFVCEATGGANAATGTVGSQGNSSCSTPFTAVCASGTCTIAVASTNAGTASLVEASAIGNLQ